MDKSEFNKHSLSFFMPAYNEEANIQKTLESVTGVLENLNFKDYEVIVVNDGSRDNTEQIIKEFSKTNPKVKVINHSVNKGYGEALKTGYYNCRFEYIVFADSDGQFDYGEISKLFEKIGNADIVVGYRLKRQDHLMRIINGWGWTQISNILFGLGVKDVDCGFKLFKREVIEKIPKLESTRGAMINPEVLAKSKKMGFKIAQVGLTHKPRRGGKQTGANLKVIIVSFIDLLKLWWKIKK